MEKAQIILILLMALGALLFIRMLIRKVTVFEYERGLLYEQGRYTTTLGPGEHWTFAPTMTVVKVDMRSQVITIAGQEVLSSDSITLKVSIAGKYELADPALAVNKNVNYVGALYYLIQVAARELIGSHTIDELIEQRNQLGQRLFEATEQEALQLGVKLTALSIKDIMLPGDLKRIFAQVVGARKEGLAALERARGESAALRNLANAARMLENNPGLLHLRALQAVGGTSGNTLILGTNGDMASLKSRGGKAGGQGEAAGQEPSEDPGQDN
jgi:regulator of protease activity HflC (stomatin/prohibitin superfamily)